MGTIQFKRGTEANLPTLAYAEPAVTLDTEKLFIGSPNGNVELAGKKSLSAVNIKYPPAPLVGAKVDGVTDDTVAIRAIIQHAESNGLGLFVPGLSVITGELEIKKTMIVEGIGPGTGYTSAGIAGYAQKSGFLVKGTGTKRIRTRRLHRASASDPQDAPLSVALNIQAEGVKLKDFSIFLDFDRTDNSPTNYGADWDVGVFVGTRTNFKTDNVHVMGYWREAGFYYDVTHATNLSRFNDLNGEPYDTGVNVSGGDGCTMYSTMAWGGKWGVFVAGAIKSDTNSDYYDELSASLVPDYRGGFGFSDFTTHACKFYGTDHHSGYRKAKATGDYLTDTAGGAMYVDGYASNANSSVWGHRHFSTRFSSFEPYRIRLDRAARVQLYGCHVEDRGSATNQDGTAVKFDATDTYGFVSATSRTNHVLLIGSNLGVLDPTFIPASVRLHQMFPSGTSTGSYTNDPMKASAFEALSGNLDLRAGSTGYIQFRQGVSTIGYMNNTVWRANSDNAVDLGSPSARYKNIYAGTGTINTSDRNAKTNIEVIPDSVLDAWSEVNYSRFKFIDAVQEKGDNARWHIGVIAQEIEEAFYRHGLSALAFGLLCYDEWGDQYDDGVLVTPAGSRYSIRPDECLMLESALMRREIQRLKQQ